ncbi:DMT family transporter [Chromohalobacter canadensis]|uniref:DMT family transporter n=1 Tax=Chromohalobacter canadensis TaxID=141389 RepID=UPI001FEC0992|nr:SMR family transporter [Chromohalobacter canadensis]
MQSSNSVVSSHCRWSISVDCSAPRLRSARQSPNGIAYAVFTGIGTVCGTLLGMLYWGESRHPLRIAFTALIVLGVVGLKLLA